MQMQIIIDKFLRSEKSHFLKLNSHERILMVMLASYMGNKDYCWPSYESLIKDCGMAKGTLNKAIKNLQTKQIINVEKVNGLNNRYNFVYDFTSSTGRLVEKIPDQHIESTRSPCELPPDQHIDANNINNNISNNNQISLNPEGKTVQELINEAMKKLGRNRSG